jgi:hypothetical protein
VQLEALASGVPIAAFPVTGPKDVIGDNPVGVLNEDLASACMDSLLISRETCRQFALRYSWDNSARQFIGHAYKVAGGAVRDAGAAPAIAEAANDVTTPILASSNTGVSHGNSA